MYDPYDDHELMEWVENASRETLEIEFMVMVTKYKAARRELRELRTAVSWERTARQQEHSGGWM